MLSTIGYEGADQEALLDAVVAAGVTVLVDVRERPLSRKAGLSKTALSRALAARGVAYRHVRDLGTPPALRKPYKLTGDWEELERGFRAHLAWRTPDLEDLADLAAREHVCLLCFEADPARCHRSLVAARLQELGLVADVTHLSVP